MSNSPSIECRPIGSVETQVPNEHIGRSRRHMVSNIVVFEEFESALVGIDEYSHLIILFWMHETERPSSYLSHPRGDTSLPLTGVFASRGRNHPNPIGLAVVELLDRHETILTVRRLDAYSGTPVLDIKPYDTYDVHTELRLPGWFKERGGEPKA